jgi:hypothetical protein
MDALNHNLVDVVDENENLWEETQDCKLLQVGSLVEKNTWIGRS